MLITSWAGWVEARAGRIPWTRAHGYSRQDAKSAKAAKDRWIPWRSWRVISLPAHSPFDGHAGSRVLRASVVGPVLVMYLPVVRAVLGSFATSRCMRCRHPTHTGRLP